jgi:hypothetical protein
LKEAIKAVRKMMEAGEQAYPDVDTAKLYRSLVTEEVNELLEAEAASNEVEEFDACLDTVWVLIGYMLARGWLVRSGWEEVARSNHSKIDPETGKMLRRDDGKYLKGPNYSAPDLAKFLA